MELETIAIGITAMVGVLAIIRPIKNLISKWWDKTVRKRSAILDDILSELKPNGGASLRDAIDRIGGRLNDVEGFITAQLNIYDIAAFRATLDGRLVYANRYFTKYLNASLSELQGEGWINFIHPDHREDTLRKWREAVVGRREFNEDVEMIIGTVHINAFREVDSTGQLRGYLGVVTSKQS